MKIKTFLDNPENRFALSQNGDGHELKFLEILTYDRATCQKWVKSDPH